MKFTISFAFLFVLLTGCASAPHVDTDHPKPAQSFPAKIDGLTYQLEYKLYAPKDNKATHPLIIMTHGRSGPSPSRNAKEVNAYGNMLRTLANKGYLVLYVVRRGYGNSDGPDVEYKETAAESGFTAAQDIKAAVEYARESLPIDKDKIVVMGQSQGGWASLAATCSDLPGVVAHVNFNGAINFQWASGKNTRSSAVEGALGDSAETFGKCSKRPSYWIYAENDNHSESVVSGWFKAYRGAGGKGALFVTKPYKDNGHYVHNAPSYYIDGLLGFFKEVGAAAE